MHTRRVGIIALHDLNRYTDEQLVLLWSVWLCLDRGILHYTEPPER